MVQVFKTIEIVLDGEHIIQNLTFGVDDEAVMLVLCKVDSDIDHTDTSNRKIFNAVQDPQDTLRFVTSC